MAFSWKKRPHMNGCVLLALLQCDAVCASAMALLGARLWCNAKSINSVIYRGTYCEHGTRSGWYILEGHILRAWWWYIPPRYILRAWKWYIPRMLGI